VDRHDTALVLHPDCGRHDTGWGHPEHQGRLPAIVQALHRDTPDFIGRILQVEAEHAPLDAVLRVHESAMVERVQVAAAAAEREGELVHLDVDTIVSPASWDAAMAAAGSALHAAEIVARGEARTAFALSRPPGHHANQFHSMGFCLFNNVAIAARGLQAQHGMERVLIVDWDVHHGNGTQDIFYADPSVFFLSLHLAGHYPGTGDAGERGAGAGLGTTRNVPLRHGITGREYRQIFQDAAASAIREFAPDFVLVSAGFDCLAGDPLGGMLLEPTDLHAAASALCELAASACDGRVVATLEGGYAPKRVGEGVRAVLRALAGLELQ
jgi:acetoin utilization deacetylase AcuC-like enzyme